MFFRTFGDVILLDAPTNITKRHEMPIIRVDMEPIMGYSDDTYRKVLDENLHRALALMVDWEIKDVKSLLLEYAPKIKKHNMPVIIFNIVDTSEILDVIFDLNIKECHCSPFHGGDLMDILRRQMKPYGQNRAS